VTCARCSTHQDFSGAQKLIHDQRPTAICFEINPIGRFVRQPLMWIDESPPEDFSILKLPIAERIRLWTNELKICAAQQKPQLLIQLGTDWSDRSTQIYIFYFCNLSIRKSPHEQVNLLSRPARCRPVCLR
jgi:hypothetical protein